MAIKFFKSLSGLSKLFKTTTKSGDSSLSPTTLDNITDIAKNQGVNENSIVHATCSESDTIEFGAQYLPGTDVLVVNGSPLVDAKNIVSGISMQVYSGYPVFIAPRGVLKATDVVRIAKIQSTTVGINGGAQTKGLTIPVWDNTKSVVFGNATYLPIITLSRLDTTLASDLMEKWRMKVATSTGTTYEINEQELNTILAAQGSIDYTGTIAFSIWRNGVQVSDWFKWYNDGIILRTKKGLYLPGVQNITYSQLMTKIKTSKLIQGRKYRITDYKPTSAYWNIIPYNTPETQLIVTAIANNILDENATLVVNLQPYEVKYSVYRRDHSAGVVYNAQFTCNVAGSTVTMTRVDDLEGISSSLYAIYNDWLINQTIEHAFKGTLYYGFQGEEICFALIPYRIDKAPVGSQLSIQVVNLAQFVSSQTTLTIDSDSWLDEYTGEIYYMRDAYGNEANFNFKGYRYTSRDTESFEYYFPFGGSKDYSENGECQNNKFLNLEQYNRTESGVKNLTIESYDVVNRVFDASCSGRIYKDAFVKSDGSSSEFLMADGSTLNGIKAKATSVAANVNPEVTFNNGTFNFKIPSGVNGEKGDKGDTGATGATGASIESVEATDVTGGKKISIKIEGNDTPTEFTILNGATGPKGEKGEKGADGTGVTIKASRADCKAVGDGYIDANGHLQMLTTLPDTFTDCGEIKGPKGDQGATGEKGADGIGITNIKDSGETSSGAARTITVTLSDTSTKTFTVYNGEKGEQGEKGDTGSVASLTQTDGSVVTSVKLETDKSLTVTRGNIGGRNLLKSSKKYSMHSWSGNIMGYSDQTDYYQITSKGTDNIAFFVNVLNYLTTKELKTHDVTVSVLVKTDVDDSIKVGIAFQKSQGNTTAMGSYYTTAQYTAVKAGEWTRIYSTFRCEHNLDETFTDSQNQTYKIGSASFIIASNNKTPVKTVYQVKDFKLELGSVPTDWSVAPEDLQTSVTSGEYPLLMKGSYIGEGYYDNDVKLDTSTNTISANISGNPATATRATVAENIQEIGLNDKSSTSVSSYDKSNPNLLDKHKFLQLHNFSDINQWKNMPPGFLYGRVIHFGCQTSGSLVGQLAYDVSGGNQAKTNNLYFRTGNPNYTNSSITTQEQAWNLSTWKRIAWASELSSYLHLSGDTMTGSLVLSYNGSPYSFGVAYNDNDSIERRLTNADLVVGYTGQNTALRTAFNRSSQQTYSYNGSNLSFGRYDINPLGGNVQVGPANTTTTVGISSASITYNKTTGCLEITA